MSAMDSVTEDYFMEVSFQITGHSYAVQTFSSKRKFRAFFGVDPVTCVNIWELIVEDAPSGCIPKFLLFGLLFLKTYSCEHVNAAICSVTEKTFRRWSWVIVDLLSNLSDELVRF